jgi:hypothetical protein
MIVYDVVQIVTPEGTRHSSYPAGRWWCEVWFDPAYAAARAELFNERCAAGGISYAVEAHDEESPDRAPEWTPGR